MTASNRIQLAVAAARAGDLAAFRQLVEATQGMAYAVAWQVLKTESDARDAVQESYLTAFKRLPELLDGEAFPSWLRRIVVTTSLNLRRRLRAVWVPTVEPTVPPILDQDEHAWSDPQQRGLARALLQLSNEERRICELFYHGRWSAERLARQAGVDAAAMRKRLQRVRDKLRKEIEMDEQMALGGREVPDGLPASIVELLARPRLTDIPENPVGAVLTLLRGAFSDFESIELAEQVDLAEAERRLGGDVVYIERSKLHAVVGERVLRYDLTLPLLLEARWTGSPQQLTAAGKVYRREIVSATHVEAFHQFELFSIGNRAEVDAWQLAGRIMGAVERVLHEAEVRVTPTDYPMCKRAWSLDVLNEGQWLELLAWGEYADWVLRALGADPAQLNALGAGFGLERMAALKYKIDDIRKIAAASLA